MIPMRRIVIPFGYGEANPVADNTTREGRQQNRRVEVKILTNKGLTASTQTTSIEPVAAPSEPARVSETVPNIYNSSPDSNVIVPKRPAGTGGPFWLNTKGENTDETDVTEDHRLSVLRF